MKDNVVRLIETEEGNLAWCNIEKKYRPVEDFHRNGRSSTGYNYRCRFCDKARAVTPEYTEEDRIFSKKILENLGYELDGEIPVHKQFLWRHNL